MWVWSFACCAVFCAPAQDLSERVDRAIDRGVQYLLAEQSFDGSFGGHQPKWPRGTTSLAAYTLLKSGLDREHPALLRARAYVTARPCAMTYPLALELLLLGAIGDSGDRKQVERALTSLLELRSRSGWNYPGDYQAGSWTGEWPDPDFSNMHYAVFGLRAAEQYGMELQKGLWKEVAESILLHLNEPEEGLTRDGREVEMAGYAYRLPDQGTKASLVAAGAAMLAVCKASPSAKMDKRTERAIDRALELNRNWLDVELEIGNNARSGMFQYYYLLALERAEALLGWEELGGLPVYEAGAAFICDAQRADGSWRDDRTHESLATVHSDTCFALLFLLRATRSVATGSHRAVASGIESTDPSFAVQVRGRITDEIEVWIEGLGGGRAAASLERVDWLLDDQIVASVSAGEQASSAGARFPARIALGDQLAHTLTAQAVTGAGETLHSEAIPVRSFAVLEPWMVPAAEACPRDLLPGTQFTLTCSSNLADHPVTNLTDDAPASLWLAEPLDATPYFELAFERPVRANLLVLHSANWKPSAAHEHGRPVEIEIQLNGQRKPLVVRLAGDDRAPYRVPLERTLKVERMRVRISASEAGSGALGTLGLGEIALELE